MTGCCISIIIPTQRRAQPLERAMRSAFGQAGVEAARLELVVADNDAEPSARETVERLAAQAPFAVRYVHEPISGVANARNAGVAAAAGALIAFLDDDEEAAPGWLAALLEVQAAFAADVVFGPVQAVAPASVTRHRDYIEGFFSRLDSSPAGLIARNYGCGDSLVRRAALPDPERPFSATRNEIGGEDDLLFGIMRAQGARIAWAPDALVWEHPAAERLSLKYTLLRAFTYGQGATERSAAAQPPDVLGVCGWMAVGLGQAAVFGLLAAIKWLIKAPDRAFVVDKALRGLGKVFWGPTFKVQFYGFDRDVGSGRRTG